MGRNVLCQGGELRRGDCLVSNNGQYRAIFQNDGNFVIYCGCNIVWASDTCGSDGVRLCMQADCEVVMYSNCCQPRWTTNVAVRPNCGTCRLTMCDNGNLVVTKGCDQIWSSACCRGRKVNCM